MISIYFKRWFLHLLTAFVFSIPILTSSCSTLPAETKAITADSTSYNDFRKSTALSLEKTRTETRKDIALAFVYHEGTSPRWDIIRPKLRAKKLHDELQFVGKDWDVTVKAYKIEVPEDFRLHYFVMDWDYLWNRLTEINPEHTHNYLHVDGGGPQFDVAGMADLSGPHAWTATGGHRIRMHEQGHAFGFGHHGKGSSIRGGASRMGSSGWGYNALNLEDAGLIRGEKGSGYYYLTYPDTEAPGTKLVHGENFALSFERSHTPEITIYRKDQGVGSWTEEVLRLGEKSTNFPIKFIDVAEGFAEVSIGNVNEVPAPQWKPLPESPINKHKAGIWHNPDQSHQGFDVHVRQGEVVAYWYTHGEDNPRWFLLQGPVKNDVANLTIWTSFNREIEEVGQAVLYFNSRNKGIIEYWLDDRDFLLKGRGKINLTRLSTKDDNVLRGIYKFEGRQHEGISVTGPENNPVIYWYGYDGLEQTWFIGFGTDPVKLFVPIDGVPLISTDSKVLHFGKAKLTEDKFIFEDTTYNLEKLF